MEKNQMRKTVETAMTYDQKKAASNLINKTLAKAGAMADFKYWRDKLPVDIENSDAVEKRLNEYLDYIERQNSTPSYEGMAMALRISVARLNQIETHMTAGVDTAEVVSRFKTLIGMMDYQLALDGVMAPSIYELRAGYFSNINKRTDINLTPVTPSRVRTPEEIEQMIKDNAAKKMIIDE